MNIKEVEKQLNIPKATIRFYEKERLIAPSREKNHYRDYSEADILRLKQIILLRKMGIHVQQIRAVLEDCLPLQDAVDQTMISLQAEMEQLNGALSLCRQIKQEGSQALDTERYWVQVQSQEQQGFLFQSLLDDYIDFAGIGYEWFLWPLPGDTLRSPKKVGIFLLGYSLLSALIQMTVYQRNFFLGFILQAGACLFAILLWTAVLLPLYLLSKRNKPLADRIMTVLLILVPLLFMLIIIGILTMGYVS